SDLHIWPLIRVALGLRSANKELGSGKVHGSWSRSDTMKQLTGLLVPNRFASSHMPQNKDILIVASGATSRPTPAGRENWLVDAFAKATEGKAAVVQDRAIAARASAAERPAFAATRSLRDAYLRVLVASKLNPLPD